VAWDIDSTSERWSLERRLRNRLLVALASLWLVGSGLALYVQRLETNELLDSAQQEAAMLALSLPDPSGTSPGILAEPALGTIPHHGENTHLQVFDKQGKLLWRSDRAPEQPMAALDAHGPITVHGRRVLVFSDKNANRVAVVSASLIDREESLMGGAQALLLPLLVLLPLTALTLTLLLKQAFNPLGELRRHLRLRSDGDLGPLPSARLPNEFKPLVDAINQLFERLAQLREAERTFAANSAHELRTPIAAAQAQLQRLAHEMSDRLDLSPADDAQIQRVDALGRQLARLQHLCVKLMQLSRAEAGVASKVETVDLSDIARLVTQEFNQPDHLERLRLELPPLGTVALAMGDMDALGIALRNLIENALLHSGPDSDVTVRVTPTPSIEVIDNGPGVAADQLDKLRQPFQRGESPSPGHGLGLSIVNAIVGQMGGALLLKSPHAQGSGLHARIVLRPASLPMVGGAGG
jgi:two-component system, OmpR family, sensor kinase